MSVILDLRDERGRFFTRVKLDNRTYFALQMLAQAWDITFEEVLHRAIVEYAESKR